MSKKRRSFSFKNPKAFSSKGLPQRWALLNKVCGRSYLMPDCTTLFLHARWQEHAMLHSNISGGSILLNS